MRLIAFLSGAVLRVLFRTILELPHQFKQGQNGSKIQIYEKNKNQMNQKPIQLVPY
jgi:hypothetical protein